VGISTVLVVEDEPLARKMARLMLQKPVYAVLEAESGPDALKVAALQRGTIDLLFTDVVIPGMGGGELAKRICMMRPETRVLYMSGYVDDLVLKQESPPGRSHSCKSPSVGSSLGRNCEPCWRARCLPAAVNGKFPACRGFF
jgi:CheY-like chemotaxis protein